MRPYLTMKELPASLRPYEKCEVYGPSVLSDAELLAVIIRTGSSGERVIDLAEEILHSLPTGTIDGLFDVSSEELQEIRGVGSVKATQLLCLAEAARRMMKSDLIANKLLCDEPQKVANSFMSEMRYLDREQVKLLVLDGGNYLTRCITISSGLFDASLVEPREVFHYALKNKAVRIIILHNHPSGDPSPSQADLAITRRLVDTGELIGIPLLDHIIIGDNCYYSIRENGYI